MMVIGKQIICMVEVSIRGKMVADMRENTIMTRNKGMEYMCGLMEGSTRECGKMESNMEKESIVYLLDKKELVYGKMGKD